MNVTTIRLLAAATLMGLGSGALADSYTTIELPGATSTEPSGISASGEIVGSYADSAGARHGFRLNGGTFTAVNYPGAPRTELVAINPRGDVAGFFLDPSNHWHGFVLSDGDYFVQDYPGATTGTFTLGLSANGTLVGEFKVGQTFGQLGYAWIQRHGQYTQLIPPGSVQAFATSVNPRGDVVGRLIDAAGRQLAWTLDKHGAYTVFQIPGASLTNARGINPRGDVVGVYLQNGVNHGFVLPMNQVAAFTTIDFPAADTTRALGINPRGDIVGTYDVAGVRRGFLLQRHGDQDDGDD